MKEIIFIVLFIFLAGNNTEKIEEFFIENTSYGNTQKSITIGEKTKNLVDFNKKYSLKEIGEKFRIELENGKIKIIENGNEKEFIENLKIQKLDKFPGNINIDLTKKHNCKEGEFYSGNFCVEREFLEDLVKKYEEYSGMGGLEVKNCLKNIEFCDEYNNFNNINYYFLNIFHDLYNVYEEDKYKKDTEISFKSFKNILIVDFFEAEKYLSSEIFFPGKYYVKSIIGNLENPNVLRILETFQYPADNDFIIDLASNTSLLTKDKVKISIKDYKKMNFIIEKGKNLIYFYDHNLWYYNEKSKNFLKDLRIEEVSNFPHNLDVDFERNPICRDDEFLSKHFFCSKKGLKSIFYESYLRLNLENLKDKIIYKDASYHYIDDNENLEIFLRKYKNYLIVDFYEGKKYLKSQVVYFQKDYNWYPIQLFLNLELKSHRRFLETYYVPED